MTEQSGRLDYDEARLKEFDQSATPLSARWALTIDNIVAQRNAEEPLLRYFDFKHLPHTELRSASQAFSDLAHEVCRNLPRTPERTVVLRKLLEAKDAAVRATVDLLKEAQ